MSSVIKVDQIQNSAGAGGLTIDSNGNILPKLPCFRAVLSNSQTVTDQAWNQITFDTEDWDIGGNYNTGTYRFQPTVAGYYSFNLILYLALAGSYDVARFIGSIGKNGVQGTGRVWDLDYYLSSQDPYQTMSGSRMWYLNGSTDYVEAFVFCDIVPDASPQINLTQSAFEGFLVSAA